MTNQLMTPIKANPITNPAGPRATLQATHRLSLGCILELGKSFVDLKFILRIASSSFCLTTYY